MAVKGKGKDREVRRVSFNGDIMKEDKDVMVDEESKEEIEDVKEREENGAVGKAHNGNEDSDKEDTEEDDREKVETKKQKRGVSNSKTKEKKQREKGKNLKGAKKKLKAKGIRKTKEPVTPSAATTERPTRERKSVERFVISNEKDLSKEFSIEKGRGTQLKDIPNVAYKLSKKRADDVLKMLHTILYGRRVKNFQIKSNISQFSGFVWGDDEEKQKIKMKEKLDKCFKSRLLEFCELLDMPVKINDKKEDLVAKLSEFMEAPHATTNVLLSEEEKSGKGKKQKGVVRSSSKSPSSSGKRLKRQKDEDSPKARRKRKLEEVRKDGHSDEDDDIEDEEEHEDEQEEQEDDACEEPGESDQEDSEEKSEDEDVKKSKGANKGSKEFPGKAATSKARKSKNATISTLFKSPSKSSSKHTKTEEKPNSKAKVFSRKKSDCKKEDKPTIPQKRKRDDKEKHKPSASKKAKKSDNEEDEKPSTSRSPLPNGKTGKENCNAIEADKKDKAGPTEEDLRKAICDILKEVDFNTATFTDILKQLAAHFNADLMPRKAEVKSMIQDELTKLADDADDADDEDDDNDEEGDGDKEDDK